MKDKLKITLMPSTKYIKEDGTFDIDECLKMSGYYAGVCYDKEGFSHIIKEDISKTMKRVQRTLNNSHHSVYGHIFITLELSNIPKMLAMVLNNEKCYNTSEKSLRYTKVTEENTSLLEITLYNKWSEILFTKIKERYGSIYNDSQIKKLAQENARYMLSSFIPTYMIYTTDFRQINYIASFMEEYIKNASTDYEKRLSKYMMEFINELDRLHILKRELMQNEKNRRLSLFKNGISEKSVFYNESYATIYTSSFAYLGQAQRHRTISYEIELMEEKSFFVPPIIMSEDLLVLDWLKDIRKVYYPQGELVKIYERATFENFLEKCKERLCSHAQLEIMMQTKKILEEYKLALQKENSPLYLDILEYTKGARCTFPDFKCNSECNFKEGITLKRII